ncbi:hypothetical protein BLA29_004531 [Euroglyphus maynei]|uniref:Chitin-binding type-2 domain-containing protein n=1 Tax=Euroglyphus maynei TaxID=6958 RepID=A0A1Y3AZR9_EURMA|nr:hypothetical protein BLA29_004531 [Euroglyphus maynei]
MAMSNELPPLTAALPMHYLSHESSSLDSHLASSLFAADPNVASLYAPHSSSLSEMTNGNLMEKPVIIAHHSHPMTLNHQQPISHYYDPITTSSHSGGETSGIIDRTLLYPQEAALLMNNNHHNELSYDGIPLDYIAGIPGKPWKDYPIYSQVPKTAFHCNGAYGYFADIETGCQLWHYCQPDGRHDSFLCTNGTLFNQITRVCDWWYNVDCKSTPHHYGVNADLYKQPLKHDFSHYTLQPSSHHHNHHASYLI